MTSKQRSYVDHLPSLATNNTNSLQNRAKAVLLRDLGELRAKRMPPATPPPEEEQPVAPPAPMDFHIDLTSFAQDSASGLTTDQSELFQFQGSGGSFKQENEEDDKHDVKQESKPVAPVPNMGGFDFSVSPEAAKVPSPALAQVKAKAIKGSPKPSPKLKGAQTAQPSSALPKKEPRATVSPQLPRATAPTPVAPPAPMHAAAMNIPPPAAQNPAPTSAPAPSPAPPVPVPATDPQPEMVFTDMAFSVDDSQGLGQMNMSNQNRQEQNQQNQQGMDDMIDLTQFMDFGAPDQNQSGTNGPTGGTSSNTNNNDSNENNNDDSNNNNNTANNNDNNSDNSQFALNSNNDISNVDAEINDILNSTGPDSAEKMDMDYELGSIGLDNNSFDDMFFADNASGGEAEYGNDSSYYGV